MSATNSDDTKEQELTEPKVTDQPSITNEEEPMPSTQQEVCNKTLQLYDHYSYM